MNTQPVIVEASYSTTPAKVWTAITDPDQMRQWFFETMNDFRAEVGFETHFIVEAHGVQYSHDWKILEVIPGKKIVYDWRHAGIPGQAMVTWELSPEGNGTHLKLTHSGLESFPQDNPDFSHESCTGGWTYFLKERLAAFLTRTNQS